MDLQRRIDAGISPNYLGNPALASNQSAHIADDENCSLWVQGLPPNVSTHELPGAIRDVGRVWQSHIVRPTGGHATAAAKLTFFTPAAARTLLERGLEVGGRLASVEYNRQKVAQQALPDTYSRVLLISGPPDVVNSVALANFFTSLFVYQIDEVVPLVLGQSINILEWRFGSCRCQAQAAFEAIRRSRWLAARGVVVNFDRDPCDYSPWGW
jgi:hypothetical protein